MLTSLSQCSSLLPVCYLYLDTHRPSRPFIHFIFYCLRFQLMVYTWVPYRQTQWVVSPSLHFSSGEYTADIYSTCIHSLFTLSIVLRHWEHNSSQNRFKNPCSHGIYILSVGEWQPTKLIKYIRELWGKSQGRKREHVYVHMCTYIKETIWGKRVPSTGTCMCKGPEVGMYLAIWNTCGVTSQCGRSRRSKGESSKR